MAPMAREDNFGKADPGTHAAGLWEVLVFEPLCGSSEIGTGWVMFPSGQLLIMVSGDCQRGCGCRAFWQLGSAEL